MQYVGLYFGLVEHLAEEMPMEWSGGIHLLLCASQIFLAESSTISWVEHVAEEMPMRWWPGWRGVFT